MASVSWRFEEIFASSPDDVFAWLADYREDDHSRPAFLRGSGAEGSDRSKARRQILSRGAGTVELEDAWGRRRFRSTVTVDAKRRTLRIRGDFGYEASWTVAPEGGAGTRLTVEGTVSARGLASVFMAMGRKSFLRQMEADFRGHVEDLRESVERAPTAP